MKILTLEEVGKILNLTPQTVRKRMMEKALPGTKIGRVWRVPEDALFAFIRNDTPRILSEELAAEIYDMAWADCLASPEKKSPREILESLKWVE